MPKVGREKKPEQRQAAAPYRHAGVELHHSLGQHLLKNPLVTAAMIETMDTQIGRVLAALKGKKMLENIVIGFSSDNGGPLDHANNAPFRGGKHTLWEVSCCMTI